MTTLIINSYNRESKLKELLSVVAPQFENVHVWLDGCVYTDVYEADNVHYFYTHRHGRERYRHLVRQNYAVALITNAKYYVHMDDDMTCTDTFAEDLFKVWDNIPDRKKIALNFHKDDRREMWGFSPSWEDKEVTRTNWTDMNFLCTEKLAKFISNHIYWEDALDWGKSTSSGVAGYFTKRINHYNMGSIYQVNDSLVKHGDHESMMNPDRPEEELKELK